MNTGRESTGNPNCGINIFPARDRVSLGYPGGPLVSAGESKPAPGSGPGASAGTLMAATVRREGAAAAHTLLPPSV